MKFFFGPYIQASSRVSVVASKLGISPIERLDTVNISTAPFLGGHGLDFEDFHKMKQIPKKVSWLSTANNRKVHDSSPRGTIFAYTVQGTTFLCCCSPPPARPTWCYDDVLSRFARGNWVRPHLSSANLSAIRFGWGRGKGGPRNPNFLSPEPGIARTWAFKNK